MGIRSVQRAGFTRTAMLMASCLAFVAMTTGLILVLHLLEAGHACCHDSHDCGICQQLLIASKKPALAPCAEWIVDVPALRTIAPVSVAPMKTCTLLASRPRGPPCSPSIRSV